MALEDIESRRLKLDALSLIVADPNRSVREPKPEL